MRAGFVTENDHALDAGRQNPPMRNARLNRVQRRVARRRIAEDKFRRQIRPEPLRAVVCRDFRHAFLRLQQLITAQPAEPSAMKKYPAIQISLRIQRQMLRLERRKRKARSICLVARRKPADRAEMIRLKIRFLRTQAHLNDTRLALQRGQPDRRFASRTRPPAAKIPHFQKPARSTDPASAIAACAIASKPSTAGSNGCFCTA